MVLALQVEGLAARLTLLTLGEELLAVDFRLCSAFLSDLIVQLAQGACAASVVWSRQLMNSLASCAQLPAI